MRSLKFAWTAALLVGFQSAFGFALLGPINEAYQVPTIGYNLSGGDKGFDPLSGIRVFGNGGVDHGAPKDFNQGYRRNTPVMYYALDANFLTYFGSNGIYAVDQAYQVFNNLPPASQMSADLSEFPLNTTRVNSTAEALFLEDLKSAVMTMMMEQLGGAEPERYVWALHDRYLPAGGTCPVDEEYLVVKRNFDPVTFLPSSYVNGTLYTYFITDLCDRPGPPAWRAVCVPVNTDGNAETWNAVTDYSMGLGRLYTGLTRDDVGLIRYLLRTNNVAVEEPPTGSLTIVTNTTQARQLLTSNLTQFAQQAMVTNAAALTALYPGLVITSSTNYPVYQWVTNITFLYYTNKPFDPAGTVPYLPVFSTNRTLTVQIRYQHTFGNLVTFKPTPGGWATVPITSLAPFAGRAFVTLQTTKATLSPWDSTASTLVTNVTSRTFLTNEVVGDFAILPTNSCGFQVAFPLLTNVYTVTNLLTSTNAFAGITNSVGGSTNQPFFSQSLVEYLTNRLFWVFDVDCQSNSPALRQGIEKITFMRRDFDSLLNRFFYPVTNHYTMITVSNSTLVPQVIQRVVTTPDFLFTGADLNSGPNALADASAFTRNVRFNTNAVGTYYPGYAGPGTIEPVTVITFNTATPVFYNFGNGSEATQVAAQIWGSYDMSTNPPIVYPSRTSLADLENLILIQVTPLYLPDATLNVPYQVQLQTQGATPKWEAPFTWAPAPGSGPLPAGLTLNADGSITGTPSQSGTFNLVVRVTDAQGRTYNRAYPFVVN